MSEGFEKVVQRPSKSRAKREPHALQQLARELSNLDLNALQGLRLDEACCAALHEIGSIKAPNRQIRYAAKLLARQDVQSAEACARARRDEQTAQSRQQHHLEMWRDRLLLGGDMEFNELLEQVPALDAQALRTVLRQARKPGDSRRSAGAARKLFRLCLSNGRGAPWI